MSRDELLEKWSISFVLLPKALQHWNVLKFVYYIVFQILTDTLFLVPRFLRSKCKRPGYLILFVSCQLKYT